MPKWYLHQPRLGKAPLGPFTVAELQKHYDRGELKSGDLARSESGGNWISVEQVPGLRIPFQSNAVVPPVRQLAANCPGCGTLLTLADAAGDQSVFCPQCWTPFVPNQVSSATVPLTQPPLIANDAMVAGALQSVGHHDGLEFTGPSELVRAYQVIHQALRLPAHKQPAIYSSFIVIPVDAHKRHLVADVASLLKLAETGEVGPTSLIYVFPTRPADEPLSPTWLNQYKSPITVLDYLKCHYEKENITDLMDASEEYKAMMRLHEENSYVAQVFKKELPDFLLGRHYDPTVTNAGIYGMCWTMHGAIAFRYLSWIIVAAISGLIFGVESQRIEIGIVLAIILSFVAGVVGYMLPYIPWKGPMGIFGALFDSFSIVTCGAAGFVYGMTRPTPTQTALSYDTWSQANHTRPWFLLRCLMFLGLGLLLTFICVSVVWIIIQFRQGGS